MNRFSLWLCAAAFTLTAYPAQADTRFDGRLREVIQERFYSDARVVSKDINVETRNRHVTLRGSVSSPSERAAAVEIVLATPGVERFTNALEVIPPKRDDAAILRDALQITPSLTKISGSTVVVDVKEQVVVLQGVFPTLSAMDRVINGLMGIQGVKDIRVSASVEPVAKIDDDYLSTATAQALVTDGTVDASKIEVGVRDGVVRLEGRAENLFQIVRAETIVRNLTGVRSVRNQIQLEERPKDTEPLS